MLATALMLGVMAALLVPGVVLGQSSLPLKPSLFFKIFIGHALVFLGIGILCSLLPQLVDPRVQLW